MTYIKKIKESTYIFPEASGGSSSSYAYTGLGDWYNQWSNVDLIGFTTIYVSIDSSSSNWGDIIIPYSKTQGNIYFSPPENINRMILRRKNGGNNRGIRMIGGYSFKINGTTKSGTVTGYTLGANGETIVFERNETDIANNNWRVYALS